MRRRPCVVCWPYLSRNGISAANKTGTPLAVEHRNYLCSRASKKRNPKPTHALAKAPATVRPISNSMTK